MTDLKFTGFTCNVLNEQVETDLETDMNDWYEIAEELADGETVDFGRAVEVWISKPHTVNRRLCGVKVKNEGTFACLCKWPPSTRFDENNVSSASYCHAVHLYKNVQGLQVEKTDCVFKKLHDGTQTCRNDVSECRGDDAKNKSLKFWIRTLLPKRIDRFHIVEEIVLMDDASCCAVFIPSRQESEDHYLTPPHLYALSWNNSAKKLSLWIHGPSKETSSQEASVLWLKTYLLPRLKKWSESQPTNSGGSLRLVPVDRYNVLYQKLKTKHGPYLVANWPERTDPSKFVFEDIAIATYLLLLWEEERFDKNLKVKQSFLDLGCGNGLLVYILAQEGHPGAGIDIRKRKVWDLFGFDTELKVASITPSPETTYPEYNWLIGNHSDELTPWIPVMAARSKFSTNFFLLPCCAHDFDSKFQRIGSDLSQYRSYLDYVRQVAEVCGFTVEEDRLRIPSTKRICFVGMKRTYTEEKENEVDKRRQDFITSRCRNGGEFRPLLVSSNESTLLPPKQEYKPSCCENVTDQRADNMWATNFQARSAIEPVRNCTRVNRELVEKIVRIVADELLATSENYVDIVAEDGSERKWNWGRRVHLASLVALVEKDDLQQLKNECGGLQTLLKNHSHIFAVYQGTVGFKNYSELVEDTKRRRQKPKLPSKPRPCWFHNHHPDACPVPKSQCRFLH